jgi:hypothetical protein
MTMNAFIALGAILWLFFVFLSVGLAQAATRGDLLFRRALAAERARRLPMPENRRGRRAA